MMPNWIVVLAVVQNLPMARAALSHAPPQRAARLLAAASRGCGSL